jgi:hypothetical protein
MADTPLEALRTLLPQLSPAPWRGPPTAPADVAFAAAAREAVPALLEALEALARTEAVRDELQAQLDALHEAHGALRERHAEMERVLGAELRRARGGGD